MRSLSAPSSWKVTENHIEVLLNNNWYTVLCNIYKSIFEATYEFYKILNISPMLFPITTGSISSPMGLGSDSLPVKVDIKGNKVYLADSMQFSLEIGARISKNGAYYIMPTFRGENIDERHLNEFVHSEVEIPGNINDIMDLAEKYIKHMVKYHIETNRDYISIVTGDIKHLENEKDYNFKKISYSEELKELNNVRNTTV